VRSDTTHNWQISKVLAFNQNTSQAIKTEDNLRFVKMAFPLKKGARWNGNQYIDEALRVTVAGEVIHIFKDWQSEVLDQADTWSNGIRSFDDVALISHADSEKSHRIPLRAGSLCPPHRADIRRNAHLRHPMPGLLQRQFLAMQ
jgi:hypothetical protein